MMKRFICLVMMIALCAMGLCAFAQEDAVLAPGTAVTVDYAQLLSGPQDTADVLMNYYPGVRAEITAVEGEYAAVTIGAQGGALSGYMHADLLAGGEASIRGEMPMMVRMNADRQVKLYSACEESAERVGEVISLSSANILGASDGWLHVNLDGMGRDSAFVRREGVSLELIQSDPMSYTYTRPMEGELPIVDAIEQAKDMVIAYGTLGSGMNTDGVTRETLDKCRAEVNAHYYPAMQPGLLYEITFYKSEDMEGPGIHAWINLWIDGMEIHSHNYGNG